jgi:hypothetical protein
MTISVASKVAHVHSQRADRIVRPTVARSRADESRRGVRGKQCTDDHTLALRREAAAASARRAKQFEVILQCIS